MWNEGAENTIVNILMGNKPGRCTAQIGKVVFLDTPYYFVNICIIINLEVLIYGICKHGQISVLCITLLNKKLIVRFQLAHFHLI